MRRVLFHYRRKQFFVKTMRMLLLLRQGMLSPFSFYMYVCFVLTIFISFVVLCCKFLGLAMVLAKFCCQAMCNFCSRRKILRKKKKKKKC